jgi:hypothetical protein
VKTIIRPKSGSHRVRHRTFSIVEGDTTLAKGTVNGTLAEASAVAARLRARAAASLAMNKPSEPSAAATRLRYGNAPISRKWVTLP